MLLDVDGTLISSFTPRRAPRLPASVKTHIVGVGSKLNPQVGRGRGGEAGEASQGGAVHRRNNGGGQGQQWQRIAGGKSI